MARRYIDFDAAIAEAAEEPVVVRYLGRDWSLYASIPAKPVLRILRLQAEGRGESDLDQGEMVGLLSQMVPPDVLAAWLDGGLTMEQMGTLMRRIVAAYTGAEGDGQGEAEGPATTGPTPCATGAPLKPTSPESTASISPRP